MKAKRKRATPITDAEKAAIRARKLLDHGFALTKDERGRDRVIKGADNRQFDIGSMKSVVRVRNVDPLVGIKSLTWQQRKAGERYRGDFAACAMPEVKTGSWDIRVDGSGQAPERPERIAEAHISLKRAHDALGYGEIRRTVEQVCGLGLSVKALSETDRNPRDVISCLLGMGLQKLAVHYGIVTDAK